MKKHLILFIMTCLISQVICADKYKIYTENYPPYNYSENGTLKGCSTEIVKEILKRLKLAYPIEETDWNSAYHFSLNNKYAITYSMTQTDARKTLFKWVGPLVTNDWAFFAKKGKPFIIKDLESARKYKIGTYYNDVCEEFLVDNGFDNIICENDDYKNIPKLVSGKIDLWLTADKRAALNFAKQAGVNPEEIYPVYNVKQSNLCIAFNRNTPDSVVKKFQSTLDQIKTDGTYAKIISNYFDKNSPYERSVPTLLSKKQNEETSKKEAIKIVDAGDKTINIPSKAVTRQPIIIKKEYTEITISVPKHQVDSLKRIATQRKIEFEAICSKAFFHYILRNKKNIRKRGRVLKKLNKQQTPESSKKTK